MSKPPRPFAPWRSIVVFAVAAVAIAACTLTPADGPVTINTTADGGACTLAKVGGVLVANPADGLAFKREGRNRPVVFPYGYSAQREGGVVFLLDPSGAAVAKEGDRITGAGANGDDVTFLMCDLEVVPASTPGT